MNKQDYLRQVDALAPSPALRARIAAMAPRARRPRPPVLRYVALAACLAAALMGGCILAYLTLEPGGELRPSPTPAETVTPSPIPEEELAWLLVRQHPDFEALEVSYPAGELVYSQSAGGRTLGVARFGDVHSAGLDNLILGVFDNRTRALVGEAFLVAGDQGDFTVWTDESDGALRILCTNAAVYQGTESPTAALFRFDGERLERVTELPPEALAADTRLALDVETMFRPDTDFWEDHKGVIQGTGLSLYSRSPDWDPARSGSEQWYFSCYLPLGTRDSLPAESQEAFQVYQAPLLPLSSTYDEEDLRRAGISVDREITVDFTDLLHGDLYARDLYSLVPRVTERYTIHNDGAEAWSFSHLYWPWRTRFYFDGSTVPAVTVDGQSVDPAVLSGASRLTEPEQTLYGTSASPASWDELAALLSGGSYLRESLERDPEAFLRQIPVAVYAVEDLVGASEGSGAILSVDFTVTNPERAVVFTFGSDSNSSFSERSYRCKFQSSQTDERNQWIIVAGGEIMSWSITGYPDVQCVPWDAIPGLSASLTRITPDRLPGWEDNLACAVKYCAEAYSRERQDGSWALLDVFHGALCDFLSAYYALPLAAAAGQRDSAPDTYYNLGWEVSNFCDEIIYSSQILFSDLSALSVPAGGSVTVELTYYHFPSTNSSTRAGLEQLYGYDIATTLGSGLPYDRVTLEVIPPEEGKVYGQTTGLDPAGGVTRVELSPEAERYWFTVQGPPAA